MAGADQSDVEYTPREQDLIDERKADILHDMLYSHETILKEIHRAVEDDDQRLWEHLAYSIAKGTNIELIFRERFENRAEEQAISELTHNGMLHDAEHNPIALEM